MLNDSTQEMSTQKEIKLSVVRKPTAFNRVWSSSETELVVPVPVTETIANWPVLAKRVACPVWRWGKSELWSLLGTGPGVYPTGKRISSPRFENCCLLGSIQACFLGYGVRFVDNNNEILVSEIEAGATMHGLEPLDVVLEYQGMLYQPLKPTLMAIKGAPLNELKTAERLARVCQASGRFWW